MAERKNAAPPKPAIRILIGGMAPLSGSDHVVCNGLDQHQTERRDQAVDATVHERRLGSQYAKRGHWLPAPSGNSPMLCHPEVPIGPTSAPSSVNSDHAILFNELNEAVLRRRNHDLGRFPDAHRLGKLADVGLPRPTCRDSG